MIAKRFHPIIPLEFGLLGYEESNSSFLKEIDISFQEVIPHQTKVPDISFLEIFTYYIYLRVKGYTACNIGMLLKKEIEHSVILTGSLGRKVKITDRTIRMMFLHILLKTNLPVLLLVRSDNAFVNFSEDSNFF